jgi:hypothetical protein
VTDPSANDPAAERANVRAALVAGAMKFLGPAREKRAEWLADRLLIYLDEISEAGSGVLDPNGTPEQIRERMLLHSKQLADTAHRCLIQAALAGLDCATRP